MRIDLFHKLVTQHEARSAGADGDKYAATFQRLFREHAATLEAAERAAGSSALIFETGWGPRQEFSISGPRSRRRFVSRSVDNPAQQCVRWRIVEVPYAPERRDARCVQPHEVQQQEAVVGPFNNLARAHALPHVSRACGACGAQRGAALKVCQACLQTRCCDAACQRSHWRQHRAACRAAAAQNEAHA
jgi:hypothetical protein